MYERFTDRARKAMRLANSEAQRFNNQYLDTEHILLGLVKDESGVAAQVLMNLGLNFEVVRREVLKLLSQDMGSAEDGEWGGRRLQSWSSLLFNRALAVIFNSIRTKFSS